LPNRCPKLALPTAAGNGSSRPRCGAAGAGAARGADRGGRASPGRMDRATARRWGHGLSTRATSPRRYQLTQHRAPCKPRCVN
jgi:hypothetical protein